MIWNIPASGKILPIERLHVSLVRTAVTRVYIMVVDQRTGGKDDEKLPLAGPVRDDVGAGNPDRGDFSNRLPPVSCGISADRVRLRLYAEVKEGGRYENRRCEVAKVFERYFEKDFQNEGLIAGKNGYRF